MVPFFRVDDAAKEIGIHVNTLRRLVRKGQVKHRRRGIGKTCLVLLPKTEIERLKRIYSLPVAR